MRLYLVTFSTGAPYKLSLHMEFPAGVLFFFIWAASWQNKQNDCAPSEDSDQPGHPSSLIRVFAVRLKKPWVLSYPLSAQRRFWSDWADAQAHLSLRWAHMLFCWFCHEAAHLFLLFFILSFSFLKPSLKADVSVGPTTKRPFPFNTFHWTWIYVRVCNLQPNVRHLILSWHNSSLKEVLISRNRHF